MPPLQPYVSNVPLQLAKNLRFTTEAGIPVTELLPIGMSGVVVTDSPTTGYISRIGALLSNQIDLYAQVDLTLKQYAGEISDLQEAVAALELSGTTIPIVNGACFSGDAQAEITTVVEAMATSLCEYITVFGSASDLTLAILAEGKDTLNIAPAFSQASAMAGLSGWISDPKTLADSINNLWKAYLDSRTALQLTKDILTPSCSQAIIDFAANFVPAPGSTSGFFVYFSGYSFIPNVYSDNGSTIKIEDGEGGIYTTGINIVNRSQPGADPLFVGISGTALSPTAASYTVTLSANILSSTNSCTKVVIHNTNQTGGTSTGDSFDVGNYSANLSGSNSVFSDFISGLGYNPRAVTVTPMNSFTAGLIKDHGYFITKTTGGAWFNFGTTTNQNDTGAFSVDWVAFK